jgi:hypothetical protein
MPIKGHLAEAWWLYLGTFHLAEIGGTQYYHRRQTINLNIMNWWQQCIFLISHKRNEACMLNLDTRGELSASCSDCFTPEEKIWNMPSFLYKDHNCYSSYQRDVFLRMNNFTGCTCCIYKCHLLRCITAGSYWCWTLATYGACSTETWKKYIYYEIQEFKLYNTDSELSHVISIHKFHYCTHILPTP